MPVTSLLSSNAIYNLCGLNLFIDKLIVGFECHWRRNPTSFSGHYPGKLQFPEDCISDGLQEVTYQNNALFRIHLWVDKRWL
jgi:hypothetical protein